MKELSKIMAKTLAVCSFAADESAAKKSKFEPEKTLVVYFSAGGNTARAANLIAQNLGAKAVELKPVQPYTNADLNYNDPKSRVSREHDDGSLRSVPLTNAKIPDWESYDVVFVGYPIWWDIAAWPVEEFIKNNDFSGKKVIAFCTVYSSGLGNSDKNLAKKANGSEWLAGKSFGERASEKEIKEWLVKF
ncbi:flavodoxin [Campylobacter concisus]|uniref:flavodoxin n=1 Tax=Campylobacter concisus TaxID=199 RepID=UPI000CD9896A|nr:flavodoxin [Campylobacter concisus]